MLKARKTCGEPRARIWARTNRLCRQGRSPTLKEYQQAIDFHQQSLAIKQKIGDRKGEANSWFNLANIQKDLQKNSEAILAYEKAQKLYQVIGLDKYVANCNKAIEESKNHTKD